MDNVPSSAILAIIAIVAACILGAFIFSTVNSQQDAGNKALSQTEQMNTALDESKYTVYDGATVTGSQVLSAIKTFKGGDVYVQVDNGSGTKTPYVLSAATAGAAKQTDAEYADALKKAKDKSSTTTYITPAAQFIGQVDRDQQNGAIIGVTFTKDSAAGSGSNG